MMGGVELAKADTVDITITDTDGTEWRFEVVSTAAGPVELDVVYAIEPVEQPPTDGFRVFEPGPSHASVKVRGRLVARSEPIDVSLPGGPPETMPGLPRAAMINRVPNRVLNESE